MDGMSEFLRRRRFWILVCLILLTAAGFRVFVSDHANRLTRAFTRPRIGRCALSANGQPAAMTAPIPRLPARLSGRQRIIDRLLAKNPDDRYPNAEEARKAILTKG